MFLLMQETFSFKSRRKPSEIKITYDTQYKTGNSDFRAVHFV